MKGGGWEEGRTGNGPSDGGGPSSDVSLTFPCYLNTPKHQLFCLYSKYFGLQYSGKAIKNVVINKNNYSSRFLLTDSNNKYEQYI